MNDLLSLALNSNDPEILSLALKLAAHPLTRFKPRPDNPQELDQQSSFYHDRFPGLACCMAGNGAGKTTTAAARIAAFLLNTPPPENHTPFWVLSQTMELVSAVSWRQGLARFLPEHTIEDIVWYRQSPGLPRTIILTPHDNGNRFVIELKSYDQAREALQGANIIGFWLDEQCPYPILTEVWARTRKWDYPGSKIYTLTPLQPDPELERIYNERDKYPSWKFYRLNTRLNKTLDPNFVRQITENEIEARIETRLTGAFAIYEGAVYPSFNTKTHVIKPFDLPRNWLRIRGLDLGWSHATACVWAAKSPEGTYYVYREYCKTKTSVEDHVNEINDDWASFPHQGPTYADPAAAQTLHEFARRGLHTRHANKDVLAGIATVQSLLRLDETGKPKMLIFDTCENLIRGLRTYVWDDKKNDRPRKKEDDLSDSIRYLAHSHRMDQGVVKYEPIKLPQGKHRYVQ